MDEVIPPSGAMGSDPATPPSPPSSAPQPTPQTNPFLDGELHSIGQPIRGYTPVVKGKTPSGRTARYELLDATTLLGELPVSNPFGNRVLANVEVTPCFLGAGWQTPEASAAAANLVQFLQMFVRCSVIATLAEYGIPGRTAIGQGNVNNAVALPFPSGAVVDGQIQTVLWDAFHAIPSLLPTPNYNSVYVAFLPSGVTVSGPNCGGQCVPPPDKGHCGYHSSINQKIPYIVMPWLDCEHCSFNGLAPFDAVTASTSHELCEAITNPITDPVSMRSWTDPNNEEIADKCSHLVPYQVDGTPFYIVRVWSNANNACR